MSSRFYLYGVWKIKHLWGNASMHGIAATKSPEGSWITKSFNTRPQWEIKQKRQKKKPFETHSDSSKNRVSVQSQHRSGSGKVFKIPPSPEEKDAASSQ